MTAEYFDSWFADIDRSEARQQLFTDCLGVPPEVGPSNLVPLVGLHQISDALKLPPGATLIDLACGRGGPGMWLARKAGVRLIGVDFSAEAIRQATLRRALFGLESSAAFQLGTLQASGLPEGVADAIVCVDAFQFATDGVAAATEVRRLLRPGRHVVLTSWEPVDRDDEAISERIRAVDLGGWLSAAGFIEVVSEERPEWHETARQMWTKVVAMDVAEDPALISTRDEGERSLTNHDRLRRVIATATAP
ncbi:MAG TPA: class I SAM-dependent methyltransferase [Mycobacteriales bacterium]|jgi:ubiquinone/menaquinone biosynthesis C-methylase UbiE|nr:class I SAM-dependent methyltransferase [Mycobacteriales bacterium]